MQKQIPIPDSVRQIIPVEALRILNNRSRPFNRAPIYYKLLKNPLLLDKNGLMIDYMKAFNNVIDVVEYEKPSKYGFKLTGVK